MISFPAISLLLHPPALSLTPSLVAFLKWAEADCAVGKEDVVSGEHTHVLPLILVSVDDFKFPMEQMLTKYMLCCIV